MLVHADRVGPKKRDGVTVRKLISDPKQNVWVPACPPPANLVPIARSSGTTQEKLLKLLLKVLCGVKNGVISTAGEAGLFRNKWHKLAATEPLRSQTHEQACVWVCIQGLWI